MTITNSAERLTWEEIVERYPDQWVGLNDIAFLDNDGITIESAVVARLGSKKELLKSHIIGEVQDSVYTTPDSFPQCWLMWDFKDGCAV